MGKQRKSEIQKYPGKNKKLFRGKKKEGNPIRQDGGVNGKKEKF